MSVAFDNPLAWGFCKYCAFLVAVDLETGLMLAHERRKGGYEFVRCYGSLLDPDPMPDPPEAKPMKWEQVAVSENSNPIPEVEVTGNVVPGTE